MDDFIKKHLRNTVEALLTNTKASDIGVDERTFQHCKNLVLVMFGEKPEQPSNLQPETMFNHANAPVRTISFKTIPFSISENGQADRALAMSMINGYFNDNPSHTIINIETIRDEQGKEFAFRFYFMT